MDAAHVDDDDAQPNRVILARNRFEDNELVGAAGVLSLSASSASLHLLDNELTVPGYPFAVLFNILLT